MTTTIGSGPFYVGIDLGGTNIKAGVVNDTGHPLSHVSVPTEAANGPTVGVERMVNAAEQAIIEAGFRTVDIVATLAGEPLYASFGYAVVERYDIALAGGLMLPAVRMTKSMERAT